MNEDGTSAEIDEDLPLCDVVEINRNLDEKRTTENQLKGALVINNHLGALKYGNLSLNYDWPVNKPPIFKIHYFHIYERLKRGDILLMGSQKSINGAMQRLWNGHEKAPSFQSTPSFPEPAELDVLIPSFCSRKPWDEVLASIKAHDDVYGESYSDNVLNCEEFASWNDPSINALVSKEADEQVQQDDHLLQISMSQDVGVFYDEDEQSNHEDDDSLVVAPSIDDTRLIEAKKLIKEWIVVRRTVVVKPWTADNQENWRETAYV
eukprot:400562_1